MFSYGTLREECRLKISESRNLRQIFGPKRDENGEWRRLHSEKLHSLYRSPNIVRMNKSGGLNWAGHVVRIEGKRAFKILTGKSIGALRRPRHRWEDNIRMAIKEIGIYTRNLLTRLRIGINEEHL